jgi:3-phenylpropionate/trans-cinnamate dioxygenase ferredoxin reductase subunit
VERRTFVIVGAGLAGVTAAATLRDEGFDGRVVLVGDEPRLPYERPPLSKEYLRGERPLERIIVRPEPWFEEQDIDIRFGQSATSLDLNAHRVALASGEEIAFDRALLATGSRARRPDIPGVELHGVHDLRTVEDAERIRSAARPGARVALVGMGFIGAELAASLRSLGVEVTTIEHGKVPLRKAVGPEVGRVLEELHRDHGVTMHLGRSVEALVGNGSFEAVVMDGGERVESDVAIIGIGASPNVELGAQLGVAPDRGILCDAELATADPRVFACGDVASHAHPLFGRIRVEHFDNALKSGDVAARNMLGAGHVFDDVHWFWSDQYEHSIQSAGVADPAGELVVRGSLADRDFSAFRLDGDRVGSVVSLDRPRDVLDTRRLIARGHSVTADQLRDETTPIKRLGAPLRTR